MVNSQSKFHSREGVEISMKNKRDLVLEKKERTTRKPQNAGKSKKGAWQKSLRRQFPRLNSSICRIYFKKKVSAI